NKTNVTKKHRNITHPKNNTTNHTKHRYHKVHDKNATGNPLFALKLVLISLGVITFKRRKH
ncbi:hypothetical protein, partial [uncultured Methanobrevibacter sp.]|uniref:hypothetical protein n=1 Tax=uncultured Methanobrevibacter sp. TaxID=253161 RepID=UPI0026333899